MNMIKSTFNIKPFKTLLKTILPASLLLLSACSMNPMEGSAAQYTSHYDRSTHVVNDFNVRSVTQAPEQIVLMFRVDVAPTEAFELVADINKLTIWFTDIKNPQVDNRLSVNGPDAFGVNSVRTCSLDGDILYEDIVHYDAKNLSYAYAIDMDKSTVSFPISNQMAMFTVESDGNGGSVISWRHYFNKNFHVMAPVLNFMMKKMIMRPAVENLFEQYGGEWIEPVSV